MADPVKIFVSSSCSHCQELKKLIESGQFTIDGQADKVEVVDVDTEEGYLAVALYNLTAVPSAYSDKGNQCRILVNNENNALDIECKKG